MTICLFVCSFQCLSLIVRKLKSSELNDGDNNEVSEWVWSLLY